MPDREAKLPIKVVDITNPGWNSSLGRYFIGQTDKLAFGRSAVAWGGIINPCHSGINVYFDIFTITNFNDKSFTAEIWLSSRLPYKDASFATLTPSNQSIIPPPESKAFMKQGSDRMESFHDGVNIFDRIVSPNSTLVSDSHQGSIIIGPGGTLAVRLKTLEGEYASATIVLTWWEERV